MSKTFKWASIVAKAKETKARVEKEHKLKLFDGCNTAETTYIFNKAVLNPGKDVTLTRDYSNCKDCTGTGINKTLKKSQYKDCSSRLIKFMEDKSKGYKAPNYITFGSEKISVRLSAYICSKIILYYNNHTRLPDEVKVQNSVFYDKKEVNKKYGHATISGCDNRGQNNGVYCGPHSMQEVIRNLTGKVIPQSTLASWAGTGSGGTGHGGIETAIAKAAKQLDVKLTCKWYNFSDLGWNGINKILKSSNQDCIVHSLYRSTWGHYEVINSISGSNVKVQNSLGSYCSRGCYCGYVEDRSTSEFRRYISGISQKSVLVVTRG